MTLTEKQLARIDVYRRQNLEATEPLSDHAVHDMMIEEGTEALHRRGEEEGDIINHPSHYTQGKIESIEYIEDCGHGESFCIGNALKYLTRYQHKNGVEDLEKAVWYINRVISNIEKEDMYTQVCRQNASSIKGDPDVIE